MMCVSQTASHRIANNYVMHRNVRNTLTFVDITDIINNGYLIDVHFAYAHIQHIRHTQHTIVRPIRVALLIAIAPARTITFMSG